MRTLLTALGLALTLGGLACGRGDIASRLAPMPDLHDDEVRVRSRDEQPIRDRRADLGFRCVWEPKRGE